MRRATSNAVGTWRPNTAAASPYSVSLATRTASSGPATGMIPTTGPLAQRLGEGLCHRAIHHDPLRRHADLSLMHEGAELGGRDRLVEIRVRKHDHRRLASELEQHALEMACRVFRHQPADARRARE